MFPTFSDTGRQSGQFFRPVCVSVPGICFRPWPSSPRLCLPTCNASVWSHARRTQRVRSAEAKRGAFVPVERHLLRRTERAERVQNTPDPPQTSISISVHERESSDVIRGSSSSSSSSSSAAAGYFSWFVSG